MTVRYQYQKRAEELDYNHILQELEHLRQRRRLLDSLIQLFEEYLRIQKGDGVGRRRLVRKAS